MRKMSESEGVDFYYKTHFVPPLIKGIMEMEIGDVYEVKFSEWKCRTDFPQKVRYVGKRDGKSFRISTQKELNRYVVKRIALPTESVL